MTAVAGTLGPRRPEDASYRGGPRPGLCMAEWHEGPRIVQATYGFRARGPEIRICAACIAAVVRGRREGRDG